MGCRGGQDAQGSKMGCKGVEMRDNDSRVTCARLVLLETPLRSKANKMTFSTSTSLA